MVTTILLIALFSTLYAVGICKHIAWYNRKYEGIHWAELVLSFVWPISIFGYLVYVGWCLKKGTKPETYIDF